jgi:ferric-dicitrate binding protein FerR (iron transport regulator)
MRTPDLAPDRLEELVGGAPPDTDAEARVERLVRELRAGAPVASRELRERVRAVDKTPAPRRRPPTAALAFAAAALVLVSLGGVLL